MNMYDDGPVYNVPLDAYFVLGDNRDDAVDSRADRSLEQRKWWTVSRASIIGPVTFIVWSGFERIGRMGLAVK